jgi:hypothetical protein
MLINSVEDREPSSHALLLVVELSLEKNSQQALAE